MPARIADPVAHFWERVDRNGPIPEKRPDLGPCWLWTGNTNADGYGRVVVNRRYEYAHRRAYELEHGELPDDVTLHHRCETLNCVRPSHLERLARAEHNSHHSAERYAGLTECPSGHPYPENRTKRGCRQCNRDRVRRAYWLRRYGTTPPSG